MWGEHQAYAAPQTRASHDFRARTGIGLERLPDAAEVFDLEVRLFRAPIRARVNFQTTERRRDSKLKHGSVAAGPIMSASSTNIRDQFVLG